MLKNLASLKFVTVWMLTFSYLGLTIKAANAHPTLKYDLSGSSNWIPYYIDNKDSDQMPGIIGELIPIILERAHIEGEHITLPPKRTNLALEKGLLDFDIVSPSWFPENNVGEAFVTSDPIMPVKEYIAYLPSLYHTKQAPKLEDFKGQEIGTVRGYYYHNDKFFKRIDFSSEKELVIALQTKRIKYAILGDLPAFYWSEQLNVPVKLGVLHSQGELHMRLRKKYQHLLPDINNAIEEIKAQGVIEEVIKHYHINYLN